LTNATSAQLLIPQHFVLFGKPELFISVAVPVQVTHLFPAETAVKDVISTGRAEELVDAM